MHLGLFGCFPFLIFVHTKRRKDTFPLEFPFTYLCKLYSNHFHCTLNFNRLCLGMVDGIWVWKSYTIVWVRVFIFFVQSLIGRNWVTCKRSDINSWWSKYILFRCCKICWIRKRAQWPIQCVFEERKLLCFCWIAYRAGTHSGGGRFVIFYCLFYPYDLNLLMVINPLYTSNQVHQLV